jgi:hypothetical protein
MHRTVIFLVFLVLAAALAAAPPARADAKSQAIREATEYALQRFGIRAATRETAEVLARRIAVSATKYGDQYVIAAVRQVGPRALRLVEEAGAHSPQLGTQAARLLAQNGEHAAWVLSRPTGLAQFARFGEGAAAALIRHKSIAEPLIEAGGAPAVRALNAIGPQNGRRLAMLAAEGGEVAQLTHSPEMLDVLAKYGNPACDFVWRNKGTLAVSAVAATFIANPEPYLNGTKELAGIAATNIARPIAEIPIEVVRHTNWTPIIFTVTLILTLLAALRWWLFRRPGPVLAVTLPPPPATPAPPPVTSGTNVNIPVTT